MRIPLTLPLLNTCTDTGYAVCAEFVTAHVCTSATHNITKSIRI